MSAESKPVRRRRRFGLPLWGLMTVVLAIGLWLASIRNRIHGQLEGFDALDQAGAWIEFDYQKENAQVKRSRGPQWVYRLMWYLGEDADFLLHDVVKVDFMGEGPLDDSLVAYLERYPHLESLTATNEHGITGSALRHLHGLTNLEYLDLTLTSLSDEDFLNLANLKKLRVLTINADVWADAGVGDDGLRHLAGLSNLEALYIGRNRRITDAGLRHLAGLTKLKRLGLNGINDISDSGLSSLAGMTKLNSLLLDDTQVGDAGLIHLRGLADLTELSLKGTRVTDAGMREIARLKNLEQLDVDQTNVGDAGVLQLTGLRRLYNLQLGRPLSNLALAALKRELPKLQVYPRKPSDGLR